MEVAPSVSWYPLATNLAFNHDIISLALCFTSKIHFVVTRPLFVCESTSF
jgi:hypothetical protein